MKKLEVNQMENLQGGIGSAEYCSSLATITQNNSISGGAAQGALMGFHAAGCGGLGYGIVLEQGTGNVIIFRAEQ